MQFWGAAYETETTNSTMIIAQSFLGADQGVTQTYLTFGTPIAPSYPSIGTTEIHWPPAQEHPLFYVGIYALITLGSAFVTVASAGVQFTGALRASRVLFKQLLVSVVRATMRWHDTTPQGLPAMSLLL